MTNLRSSHRSRGGIVSLLTSLVLMFGLGLPTACGASESGGFRIFTVKRISPDFARKFLSDAGIGSVSQLSGSPSLLVTGAPEDVARAKAVLDLVDVQQKFAVKVMGASLKPEILPPSEAIAEKLTGMSVGTFASPPETKDGSAALVDIHNGKLIIIAQESRLGRVVEAVGRLLQAKKDAAGPDETTAEPTKIAPPPVKASQSPPPIQPRVGKIDVVRPADANLPTNGSVRPIPPQPVNSQTSPPPIKAEPLKKSTGLYQPDTLPGVGGNLTVSLPQKLDIVRLLQLAGEFLDLNFMYDPLKVKGEVTILWTGNQKGTIKVAELYPLMESVLQFHGFAMTRNPGANMVTVTPTTDIMDKDPPIIEDDSDKITEYGNVIVTRIFKLEHIDAASAQNLLTGMKLGTNVSPVGDAQVLFVTGYAYRMPRVERLLKMIDKPGKPKKIRFRTCKFTMATALAPKVKTLAEQLGTVSITVGQMATSEPSTSSSARKPGETTAAYTQRLAAERAARSAPSPSRTSSTTTTPGVYLDADERTNRILMIGFDEELDSVEELIDTLDVEQTDLRTLKLYQIEHIDAEQARKKLQELGIVSGGGLSSSSSNSRITNRSTRVGAATTSAAPSASRAPAPAMTSTSSDIFDEGGGLVGEPVVVIIEPTNSLLVNATAEQHAQIQTILKYVDARTETGTIPYVIYPLENQKPEDLAGILEKLIQETVKDKEGKIEQVIKKTDEEIVIVPDENTFSIIVYASKKNQEWIKNLIETLDKRRPQVLIDVTLVEVSKGDAFEYDLNAIQSFPDLTNTSGLTRALLPGVDPNGANLVQRLIDSGQKSYRDFQVSNGRGTGFYGDRHINALLTLMQTKDYGRIMARPKILVNDNEQGSISTTDTTYVEKKSSIPLSTTGTGTSVTTVTTQIDYQDYDAGIQLDITPHISEGQLLRLEIVLTRSDFTGPTGGEKPPNTTATDITTVVTVPDGSTIILGGLVKLNQGKGGTKVPFFGDLPLIGGLFRSVSNSDIQKRTYIFVRAEIIRPAETLAQGLPDLEKLSQRDRLAFERFENEFQDYKSFPGVKAKPMQPLRVLELE